MTPEQVMKALAADWRQNAMTYHDIAQITGYKYSTIANFIANKKTYFTLAQASRFKSMGYNIDFLMYGKGTLRLEDDPGKIAENANEFLPDSYKVTFLMYILKTVADFTDHPLVQVIQKKVYRAFTTKDRDECAEALAEITETIALALATSGIVYDQSGIAYRVETEGRDSNNDEESDSE